MSKRDETAGFEPVSPLIQWFFQISLRALQLQINIQY